MATATKTKKTPSVKTEVKETEVVVETPKVNVEVKPKSLHDMVTDIKAKAMKLRRVIISNNDVRENAEITAITAGCENAYFGITRIVPLGIAVEIEQCIIDTLKEVKIPIHMVSNVGNLKGTSNRRMVNKYSISYQD